MSSHPEEAYSSGSDLSAPKAKRTRAAVACMSCRRKKTKCDTKKPVCGNCSRSKIVCKYPSTTQRRRSGVSADRHNDSNKKLVNRIRKLESMVQLLLENQGINFQETKDNNESPSDDSDSDDANEFESDSDETQSGNSNENTPMDIFQLKERRAPAVVRWGDSEPLLPYSHGFTHILMSPKSMRWLCERIGNHALAKDAEILLIRLWKRKAEISLDAGKRECDVSPLDPVFIEKSMATHAESTSEIFHVLLDSRDVRIVNKICCPSGDFSKVNMNSPYAILYPALVMVMTGYGSYIHSDSPLKDFSTEYINEQTERAFNLCMKHVPALAVTPSTFLLLRLLMLSIFAIQQRSIVPQLRSLVSIAICMSVNLGLHRGEVSRYLSTEEQKRRSHTWALVQDTDIRMSVLLSLMPLLANISSNPLLQIYDFKAGGDMHALSYSMHLNRIYLEVYQRLFSPKARKCSIKTLLRRIAVLDKKLNDWKDNIPESWIETMRYVTVKEKQESQKMKFNSTRPSVPGERNRSSDEDSLAANFGSGVSREKCCMWVHASTIICYYNIMILIHSIPAFSPSCLKEFENDPGGVPPRLLSSLTTISECAKGILKFSFNSKEVHSDQTLAMIATNAFSALFLKQIRDPMHITNGDDLIQIYRYITRFHYITQAKSSVDTPGIMNIWLIFANALTQLNREYPSSTNPQSLKDSKLNATSKGRESSNGQLNTPIQMSQSLDSISVNSSKSGNTEHVFLKTPQLNGAHSIPPIQPLMFSYHLTKSNPPNSHSAHFNTNVELSAPLPQSTSLSSLSTYMMHKPTTTTTTSSSSSSSSSSQQQNCQQPYPTRQQSGRNLSVPLDSPEPNGFSWTTRSQGHENNLWETFSGMEGPELDLQDDIFHVHDPMTAIDYQDEQTLNNCTIC